ncbi:MAG: VWA domain-containing protein [Planctomycetes bacterium]|nr:VWA domain-containing protein [Planctomycetota bacterium]
MKLHRVARAVFPARRRQVTVAGVLPLALFMVVFFAAWGVFELTRFITFQSPVMMGLVAVTPWIWWMSYQGWGGLDRVRSLFALVLRLLVAGTFIMMLAEPRAVRTSDVVSLVYVLDQSYSIGDQVSNDVLSFVTRTVSEKPSADEAGLVVFGNQAVVELPPRVSFPFEVITSRVDRDGTNIDKALSLAAAVIPEYNQGRIVFISDGTQTAGELTPAIDRLNARDISVDVLPVSYGFEHEVWLERLDLPRFVKVGETYEASAILSSLTAGSGRLVLHENGREIFSDEVNFNAGKNRFVLPLYLRTPGYYEYVASVSVAEGMDGWRENNTAVNHLYIAAKGSILLVTDPYGDERDWATLLGSLKKAELNVELRPPLEFPRDALSLLPYDCIIFANVPADSFDVVQMNALRDAVHNQGSGFIMVGGADSFGPGGYNRTPVEEILPVTMDVTHKKVLPKGALVIVLHTCEFSEGNTWGKRIAKEAIRVLGAKDEVGVLVYDWQGREKWLFRLTPARFYDKLAKLINEANIGDMPSFGTTMRMALTELKQSDAAMKHAIIISDGDPSPPTPELVNGFVQEKISISTVGINPHSNTDVNTLSVIASATGGRFYFPKTASKLPGIFIKEAKTLKRSMIQNKTFVPSVEFVSPVVKGVDEFPPLRGYILTTPKARSEVVLEGPEQDEVDPVLAVWRFGVGRAAAFTSDLSPNWAADWVEWTGYDAFVKQLVSDVSRVTRKSDLHVTTQVFGDTAVITVDDYNPAASLLDIRARISGPLNRDETLLLKQAGPHRYEARVPVWGKGSYHVVVAGRTGDRAEQAFGGYTVPYSTEYLRFRATPSVLRRIAENTGGRILTGAETGAELFGKTRKPRESTRSVVDVFLLILACLIPLDVAVRRVQIDWQVIRSWLGFGKYKEAVAGTLGSLLKRKHEISFAGREDGRPLPPPAAPRTKTAGAGRLEPPLSPPATPETGKTSPEDVPDTTTGRLLALKKKWKNKRRDGD